MRVMVLVKATEDSEKGFVRTPQTMAMMEAMGKFNDELQKAGILRDAEGDKRFLRIEEYRRVIRSFSEFDALVSAIAREHEVEVDQA